MSRGGRAKEGQHSAGHVEPEADALTKAMAPIELALFVIIENGRRWTTDVNRPEIRVVKIGHPDLGGQSEKAVARSSHSFPNYSSVSPPCPHQVQKTSVLLPVAFLASTNLLSPTILHPPPLHALHVTGACLSADYTIIPALLLAGAAKEQWTRKPPLWELLLNAL